MNPTIPSIAGNSWLSISECPKPGRYLEIDERRAVRFRYLIKKRVPRLTIVYCSGGCLRCKQRKIKCDESLPQCNQCARRALDCPGYVRPLKWSSKYEIWDSTAAPRDDINDVNRSMCRITNDAKKSEHVLPQTSRSLSDSGGPSSAGRELVSKADHEGDPTGPGSNEIFNLDSDRLLGPLLFSRPSIDDFFFDTVTQSQSIDTATLWNDLLVASPQIVEDQSTRLSRHYFSSICRMNCCFDSSKNPFRVWVAESMHSYPPLYHCILSMSASHLAARQQGDLVPVALEHRAEAISRLGSELVGGDLQSSSKACSSYEGPSQALLACILLGMTDVRLILNAMKRGRTDSGLGLA